MNLYLSTLFAWAGLAVAIACLVWALNGLYMIAADAWRGWRIRGLLNGLWDDKIGAGGSNLPRWARVGTTADTSAGTSLRPFDREAS